VYTCKDWESGVRAVREVLEGNAAEPPSVGVVVEAPPAPAERLPFLAADGTLVIPFDSPERYHWWKPPHEERMRVAETLNEVRAGLASEKG
jgi:hypothetical protein